MLSLRSAQPPIWEHSRESLGECSVSVSGLTWSSHCFQALRTKAPFSWINPTTLCYTGPSTLWQLTNLPEVGTLTKTKINKLWGLFTFMHNLKWANKETNNLFMNSLSWGMNFGTSCEPKSEKVGHSNLFRSKGQHFSSSLCNHMAIPKYVYLMNFQHVQPVVKWPCCGYF